MKVVLFFAAMYLSGPSVESPKAFASMEDCQELLGKLPAVVADYNAGSADDKILAFAAECVPFKKAKFGKDV